ncbi:unnamed protein product, partial [Rotaria sp. Silwood2]
VTNNEDGNADVSVDESLKSEFADELLYESICLFRTLSNLSSSSSSHLCIIDDVVMLEISVNDRLLLCNNKDFSEPAFANVTLRRTGSGV